MGPDASSSIGGPGPVVSLPDAASSPVLEASATPAIPQVSPAAPATPQVLAGSTEATAKADKAPQRPEHDD